MSFGAGRYAREMRLGERPAPARAGEAALEAKAQRLLGLWKARDAHFRRAVMGDGAMGAMLSLFLAEIRSVPLSEAALSLVTMLDAESGRCTIETLIHAGLASVTGDTPERRTVGLTPLGSARMRSYITDHPDL